MKHTYRILTFFWLLMIASCVTINVYFPAAAAEQAADRIIRDVYGETPEQRDEVPQPQSRQGTGGMVTVSVLDWLIAPAEAAADISVQSPAIQKLRASMKARHRQLLPYYDSGAVGMTREGLIAVRDLKAVPLRERSKLQALVKAENRDRNALYAEIARANGRPEWESEIRATFARRWVDNAPAGWWYQDGEGDWQRK
jgi:uncharacterized protein YdbL (DUF1318 family)